ncbi:MAG: hypothetical protein J6N54_02425 [Bacteroidales bacterium]|nr:hypothetical protein [Bacteroidales bacterium]
MVESEHPSSTARACTPRALSHQHFEDFEKNAVSNFEEIEKNRIKDFEDFANLRFIRPLKEKEIPPAPEVELAPSDFLP